MLLRHDQPKVKTVTMINTHKGAKVRYGGVEMKVVAARGFDSLTLQSKTGEYFDAPLADLEQEASRNADAGKVERFAAERLRTIFSFVSDPIPILASRKLRQFSLFLLSGNPKERAIALIRKGVASQIKKYGGRG